MSKYDNRVYMVICEVSIVLFDTTNYITYRQYGNVMKLSLSSFNVSQIRDITHFVIISKVLEKIFSIDTKTSMNYLIDYFQKEKYLIFEKPIRDFKRFYPSIDPIYEL